VKLANLMQNAPSLLVAPFGEICLMMYPKFKYLHRIALFGSFKNMNNNILIQQNHKLTYNVLLEE
jgi:hypothetical protein